MSYDMKFKDFKKYVSVIDRVSICMQDTLQYDNYRYMADVPNGKYDDYYVYGVGLIQSEFEIGPDGPDSLEKENMINNKYCLMECMEIMLSKAPRDVINSESKDEEEELSKEPIKIGIEVDDSGLLHFCREWVHKRFDNYYCTGKSIHYREWQPMYVEFREMKYTYEIFELLGHDWGNWNDCPVWWTMRDKAKEWFERYGAEVEELSHDTVVFKVQKPLSEEQRESFISEVVEFAPNSQDIDKPENIRKRLEKEGRIILWWD